MNKWKLGMSFWMVRNLFPTKKAAKKFKKKIRALSIPWGGKIEKYKQETNQDEIIKDSVAVAKAYLEANGYKVKKNV